MSDCSADGNLAMVRKQLQACGVMFIAELICEDESSEALLSFSQFITFVFLCDVAMWSSEFLSLWGVALCAFVCLRV